MGIVREAQTLYRIGLNQFSVHQTSSFVVVTKIHVYLELHKARTEAPPALSLILRGCLALTPEEGVLLNPCLHL